MPTGSITPIRVKEVNGDWRTIGYIKGDTFTTHPRDETQHGFRGGADTWREAVEKHTAGWGIDLIAMERLAVNHGIQYVEVRGKLARYRTMMDTLLGPKSYVVEFAGHRRQTILPLSFWTQLPR